MIEVLHFIESLGDFGGTPIKLLTIQRHSEPTRVRHRFVTMTAGALDDQFRIAGADVRSCDTIEPRALLTAYRQEIGARRPDVVCTHFRRALLVGALAAESTRVPFVHHEHGPAELAEGGSSARSRLLRVGKALALRRAAGIIANSAYTARSLSSVFRASTRRLRIEVLHNPVARRQPDFSAGSESTQGSTCMRVGHVGGLIGWRDQATLIAAAAQLRDRGRSVHVTIVGDGPLRAQLAQQIASLGLQDVVELVGYREDIGPLLSSFDAYVNPAVSEGFGIAVVEAMLAGLPVVLAASGAHPELVDDGRTGFLYEPGAPEALARVLSHLHDCPELRSEVGANAARAAASRFDPRAVAGRYTDLLESFSIRRQA